MEPSRKSEGDEEVNESSVLWEDALPHHDSDGDLEEVEYTGPSPQEYFKSGLQYIPGQGMPRYSVALRNLIPIRRAKKKKTALGVDEAGFWSTITYKWLTKFIYRAYKKGITLDDIPEGSPYDSSEYCVQRLETLWMDELAAKGAQSASLYKVTWKFVRTRVIIAMILILLSYFLAFISIAFFMRKLINFAQNPEAPYSEGITWAVLLTANELVRVTIYSYFWTVNYRTSIRLRAACLNLLYRKILRLHSLGEQSVGELINLFASDGDRIFQAVPMGSLIVTAPLSCILIVIYIWWQLSLWGAVGFCCFFCFYALQHLLSIVEGKTRKKAIVLADSRVSLITEIINSIKTIKLYAWTTIFSKKIFALWKKEISFVRKAAYCESFGSSLSSTSPIITAIVVILAHTAAGYSLNAAQAFTLLSLCTRMVRNSLNFTRDGLRSLINYRITVKRLKKALILQETKVYLSRPLDKSQAVSIANASFSRHASGQESKPMKSVPKNDEETHDDEALDPNPSVTSPPMVEVLTDISFSAKKGSLVGICGEVGSGKTTLLHAILGQLTMSKGKLCRLGSCAYVAQQPWLLNATFKENVLFGEKFDAKKYFNTLYCCSLNEDANMLPGGDETEIGERGINLSGGQKQRISLARAVYADQDIYLLDDPLSAVDNSVARHIFSRCIKGTLKGKTVLFVTHRLEFLSECDDVVIMKEGTVLERGSYKELVDRSEEFQNLIKSSNSNDNLPSEPLSPSMEAGNGDVNKEQLKNGSISGTEILPGGILVTNEKVETGSFRLDTIATYVKAAGGLFVAIFVIFIMLLNVGSSAFSSWWLAYWIKSGELTSRIVAPVVNVTVSPVSTTLSSVNVTEMFNVTEASNSSVDSAQPIASGPAFSHYQLVYALTIAIILATNVIRAVVFTTFSIKAATSIHATLFNKLVKGPMKFFEVTPSGRIHNLFSKDIDEVENHLPYTLERLLQQMWSLIFAIFFVALAFPYFIIPLMFLGGLFYTVTQIFRVGIRDLKRMENVSRSPIFSNVTTTLLGLDTIHAFRKEKDFARKFSSSFDRNTTCMFMNLIGARWIGLRLDILAVIIVGVTSAFVIFLHGHIAPAMAGLAIAYAAMISGLFQYTVRVGVECENKFLSVERINMYLSGIETEGGHGPKGIPRLTWPELGSIRFSHVNLAYRLGLPLALNDVSFKIRPAEKIGIVGRTGSGKSSLLSALFRLVEINSGSIRVDDLDISTLDLEILRSRLTIIPQDPVLFQGSVRSNLDPGSTYNDEEIWSALEKTNLKDKISSMEGGLSSVVVASGENFSAGEKQLFCLARVLLRRSKIILFDEATSGIDPETEKVILETIGKEFKDCTVLTIAHRLETILSCDRIIVMSKGQVVEFDEPKELQLNTNTIFSKMMASMSKPSNTSQ